VVNRGEDDLTDDEIEKKVENRLRDLIVLSRNKAAGAEDTPDADEYESETIESENGASAPMSEPSDDAETSDDTDQGM
jgi:hypothetical protein